MPVVANGDITSPEKAREVLARTGADAIMVGRAAQGGRGSSARSATFWPRASTLAPPLVAEVRRLLLDHLQDHYQLYGAASGVRSARKHIGWYVRRLPGGEDFRQYINTIADSRVQWQAVAGFLDALGEQMDRLPAPHDGLHRATRTRGIDCMSKQHIEECVRESLQGYFRDLGGETPDGMYDMLVRVVEKPLLEVVMSHADNNQSRAAEWLGLNRNTLRKKLVEHKLL
jgi:DNA-binding protein Fis